MSKHLELELVKVIVVQTVQTALAVVTSGLPDRDVEAMVAAYLGVDVEDVYVDARILAPVELALASGEIFVDG